MTSNSAITASNLTKSFEDTKAVSELCFSVPEGTVLGLIGTNGAGKTTTMRMLVTLDSPDHGTLHIAGINALHFPNKVRSKIGWMPDSFGVYPNTLVYEYIDFFARAYGLRGQHKATRVREIMEFTDLDEIANKAVESLSKGMKQRLCLGRMLLSDPEIMVMDEPAAGLDPKARLQLKKLIKHLNGAGKTIVISSHILNELQDVCDSFMFLHKGIVRFNGSLSELQAVYSPKALYRIRCTQDQVNHLREWCLINRGVEPVEQLNDALMVTLEDSGPDHAHAILRKLIEDGIKVHEFATVTQRLEDVFVELVGTSEQGDE